MNGDGSGDVDGKGGVSCDGCGGGKSSGSGNGHGDGSGGNGNRGGHDVGGGKERIQLVVAFSLLVFCPSTFSSNANKSCFFCLFAQRKIPAR